MINLKQWADLHGEEGDDRPCSHWVAADPGTYYEPGEPAHCSDPVHCAQHWRECLDRPRIFRPQVECPVCHHVTVVDRYAFDDHAECIVAAPKSMCEQCEMESEDPE